MRPKCTPFQRKIVENCVSSGVQPPNPAGELTTLPQSPGVVRSFLSSAIAAYRLNHLQFPLLRHYLAPHAPEPNSAYDHAPILGDLNMKFTGCIKPMPWCLCFYLCFKIHAPLSAPISLSLSLSVCLSLSVSLSLSFALSL